MKARLPTTAGMTRKSARFVALIVPPEAIVKVPLPVAT